ncbi:protein kinase [Candidatus Obscuribacterales bacterium]|nr:protein kinase [Candidatus Obscuribacterales bacterium]
MSDFNHEPEKARKGLNPELIANAEPGIKLKVSDPEEERLISSAVSSITEPLAAVSNVSSKEQTTDATGDELLGLVSEKSGEKKVDPNESKFKALKKLPTLLPAIIFFIAGCNDPFAMIIFSYFYWTFASYRTARAMVDVHGATNIKPLRILNMAPVPVYAMLIFALVMLPIRMFNMPPSLGYFPLAVWALLLVAYTIYQWKWPISSSITLSQIEKRHGVDSGVPAWIKHFGIGLLFNLSPIVVIGSSFITFTLSRFNGALTRSTFLVDPNVYSVVFALVFIVAQYLGFYLLKRRIVAAAMLDRDFRIYSERAKNSPPKVSDDDMIVRYRAFADWERWFKHRMKERSNKKLMFLIATVAIFFLVGAPQWCLDNLTHVPGVATAAATAASSGPTINFLNVFQTFLLGICGIGGFLYLLKPTHIGFSAKGIRYLWRHSIIDVNGDYIKWSAFHKIRLFMPKGKTSPADQCLLFDAGGDKGADRNVKIKLSSVMQVDDRERILKAIERYAPGVERDASVLQILQRPADHSYTELWLQALAAPPKRERFKPLSDGASLQDKRFEILGQLGVGGQGTAYLANDLHAKGTVVLKEFILPVYVEVSVRRQALERFENEARILKQLDHDQIVKLLDFFVEDHRSYLVLEHIEGKSLKQIVEEQGALSETQVLGLAKQMCTMLEYLHGLEPPVVHRDFTPDNLILRPDGKLKLVDFNVAQQTDSTATGTVVGKHAYLPPEQFRGTPVAQSDLYSLGATLHYLLTATEPEPISVSHPKRINDTVSDNMDLLVARATAMSLEARHQNVEELRNEINDFFDEGSSELV